MELTGAQIVMKSLEDEGVETIFGLPGGTVVTLYDAIYDSKIEHVLVRHEQAAAHAADGFSRASVGKNKVGVCVATSGPGATNLVTGIATAFMDSSPMLAITGQVATTALGTDFFQEAHMLGISLPIVKHSIQVRAPEEISQAVSDAMYIASSGRPGPVLIDLPADVQRQTGEYRRPTSFSYSGYDPDEGEELSGLLEAAKLIRKAERPIVVAGNGVNVSRCWDSLKRFAEALDMPIATSLLGKGAIPDGHPNAIGMLGMHGNAAVNRGIMKADLIIAVGSRLSDRSTGRQDGFANGADIIHIDRDVAEIHKNVDADVWLIGDAGHVLDMLTGKAGGHSSSPRKAWLDELREMERKEPFARNAGGGEILPWQVMEALDDVTQGEAVITTEVGQHQMWAAQYHRAKHPKRFITSGGLGTMGFGLPASIGAHYACPGLPVFCVAGDGSAMMNIQELDTYARYNLPIKVLLLDNNCLGMVRQWQELFYGKRYSSTLYTRCPDFVKIAQGMGVEAFSVSGPEALRPAIERALSVSGPALVHIPIPQSEKVFPMIPSGAPLDQMILA